MSVVGDIFQAAGNLVGGGGGNTGGGFEGFASFYSWLMQQQEQQRTLAERDLERSKALTEYRRGEIQDRTGYAGLVNVGDATLRSDATLAAEMARIHDTLKEPPPPQAFEDGPGYRMPAITPGKIPWTPDVAPVPPPYTQPAKQKRSVPVTTYGTPDTYGS